MTDPRGSEVGKLLGKRTLKRVRSPYDAAGDLKVSGYLTEARGLTY